MELSQTHNVELLLTLGMTPQWASSRPIESAKGFDAYGKGAQAPPVRIEDWRAYIRTVATRYRGKIRDYEIWNEPDQPGFFSGSPQQMVALSKAGYEVLKSVDSNNVVVSPSVKCDRSGRTWLRRFFEDGGGRYADVVGAHFYVMPAGPEAMVSQIEHLHALMQEYGIKQPLWNTEAGWGPPSIFSSQDNEAAFLIRTFFLNAAAGIERVYWYAWDNTNWVTLRLTDPSTGAPQRAALAYARLSRWLNGTQIEQCRTDEGSNWSCRVTRANGEHWLVLWNITSTAHSHYPNISNADSFPCTGDPAVRTSTVAVGSCPVMIRQVQ